MNKQRGITLMELMVVMVVIAILSAIAFPSYRQYMIRTNRTSAKTALLSAAQNLERCFTRNNTYVGCTGPGGAAIAPVDTADGHYRITLNVPSATEYDLLATPQGGQVKDTTCGNVGLDETGTPSASGQATPQLAREKCWGR